MAVHPTTALKRAAFLVALERNGNVLQAAQEVSTARSSFYDYRRRDPEFGAAWAAAMAKGRANVLSGTARYLRRTHRWTDENEAKFLHELAITCNVTKAARAVGMTMHSAYRRRAVSPQFRAGWTLALDEAMTRMAMRLARQAMNGVDEVGSPASDAGLAPKDAAQTLRKIAEEDEERPVADPQLALALLKHHQTASGAPRSSARATRKPGPDIETVKARVIAQIAALKRAREEPE